MRYPFVILLALSLSACGSTTLPMGMGRCYADANFAFCIVELRDAESRTSEVVVPGSTVLSAIGGVEQGVVGTTAVAAAVGVHR